jgi:hypothetical protein
MNRRLVLLAVLLSGQPAPAAEPRPWKAGVAVQVITPDGPMWLSGYASRKAPAEGKVHDLHVKALALEGPDGTRLVLLTSDLVGVPHGLAEDVCVELKKRAGLERGQVMLTCSHTHCGPVVRDNLADMYDMPPEEAKKIAPYTAKLKVWMVETVERALKDLKPAKLSHGQGTARFAVNRRKPTDKGIINDANPDGPVDHDVPVLKVEGADGKLRAVVFGYACHNTTMQFLKWCGDYAGFAQIDLEAKHPGAVALFWAGCGGDANPLPRSKIELCEKYGRELADAVESVLAGRTAVNEGPVAYRFETISLPFASVPTREQLAADMLSKTFAVRKRAERFSKMLDEGKKIDSEYPYYPVQVWRLGGVCWLALGGEVVVDYSHRLKRELRAEGRAVWVTAYANDVMAYIPSERVLREGGYEGDTSMVGYGQPSKWAAGLEDKIVGKAKSLAGTTFK